MGEVADLSHLQDFHKDTTSRKIAQAAKSAQRSMHISLVKDQGGSVELQLQSIVVVSRVRLRQAHLEGTAAKPRRKSARTRVALIKLGLAKAGLPEQVDICSRLRRDCATIPLVTRRQLYTFRRKTRSTWLGLYGASTAVNAVSHAGRGTQHQESIGIIPVSLSISHGAGLRSTSNREGCNPPADQSLRPQISALSLVAAG